MRLHNVLVRKEDEVRTDLAFSSAYVRYSRRTLWIILWSMTDLWKKVIQNKLILCCLSLSTGNTNCIKISFSTLTDNLADFHPVFKYIYMKIKQNTSCYLMLQDIIRLKNKFYINSSQVEVGFNLFVFMPYVKSLSGLGVLSP